MSFRSKIERGVDWLLTLGRPGKMAEREHFRLFVRDHAYRERFLAIMNSRGYRAGKTGPGQTPWLGGGRSADAEILGDLPKLVNRSRELNRDDPVGTGITKSIVNNVIGTGMVPQARTDSPTKNKALEAYWKKQRNQTALADDMTHGEAQRMRFSKVLEDGGTFVKKTKRTLGDRTWFETIEKDRISTPASKKPADPLGSIRDGVEKDRYGIPVAYWIRKGYPSDFGHGKLEFERVDASVVNHLKVGATRPGQTHGVPIFHAVLQDLRDLDLLMLASLKRVQIAACLAVFLETPEMLENVIDKTAKKYGYVLDQRLSPGMIMKTLPGEKVSTLVPNFPTPQLEPFVVMLCRRIGASLGLSWQIILKDFSKSTYSSARTDLLESRQVYVILQKWFAEKELNWEWQAVMEDGVLSGDPLLAGVTLEDIVEGMVQWIPNGWRWIDPKKEAEGIKLQMDMKLTTRRDEAAALGKDWEDLLVQAAKEEAREKEIREEFGLGPKKEAATPPPFGKPKEDDDEEDEEADDKDEDKDEDDGDKIERMFMEQLEEVVGEAKARGLINA